MVTRDAARRARGVGLPKEVALVVGLLLLGLEHGLKGRLHLIVDLLGAVDLLLVVEPESGGGRWPILRDYPECGDVLLHLRGGRQRGRSLPGSHHLQLTRPGEVGRAEE